MLRNLRYVRAAWLSALVIAPALLADCSDGPVSLGSAGASNAGSSSAGATGIGGGSGGDNATCATSACGPALGIANYQCPDGSEAGPTGRCLKNANGTCGWEIHTCPIGAGGSGGASAGAGGQAAAGDSGQTCGGQVCGADQMCCGPASCGRCISKLSGQSCPAECSGGSGGTSSGGSGGTSSGGGSGGTTSGGSSGAGGSDCASLLTDLQAKVAAARGCNTASAKPGMECAGTLEGLCCPVLVEAATTSNSPANTAYLDALHAYKQSCNHICPAIACLNPQPGDCVAAQGSTSGTCGGGTGL
jgi:hypothetical protein